MKIPHPVLLLTLAALVLLPACSTVESRISQHQAAYASWPPAVQQAVSAGRINVGFTPEQVRVALGNPDHVFVRTTPTGSHEVWSYHDHGPRFDFGLGMGSFHGGSAYGGGVNMSTGGYRGERIRVVFDQTGRVSQIEQVQRG